MARRNSEIPSSSEMISRLQKSWKAMGSMHGGNQLGRVVGGKADRSHEKGALAITA